MPQLLAAIEALAYPRTKLDVKFILEDGDDETAAVLRRAAPPYSEIIIMPAGLPRTKPRALNAALSLVRGELVAVYDAEDIPDPQQLRRAAARFAVAPSRLACLQARLAIDNIGDGWLAHGLMTQTPEDISSTIPILKEWNRPQTSMRLPLSKSAALQSRVRFRVLKIACAISARWPKPSITRYGYSIPI